MVFSVIHPLLPLTSTVGHPPPPSPPVLNLTLITCDSPWASVVAVTRRSIPFTIGVGTWYDGDVDTILDHVVPPSARDRHSQACIRHVRSVAVATKDGSSPGSTRATPGLTIAKPCTVSVVVAGCELEPRHRMDSQLVPALWTTQRTSRLTALPPKINEAAPATLDPHPVLPTFRTNHRYEYRPSPPAGLATNCPDPPTANSLGPVTTAVTGLTILPFDIRTHGSPISINRQNVSRYSGHSSPAAPTATRATSPIRVVRSVPNTPVTNFCPNIREPSMRAAREGPNPPHGPRPGSSMPDSRSGRPVHGTSTSPRSHDSPRMKGCSAQFGAEELQLKLADCNQKSQLLFCEAVPVIATTLRPSSMAATVTARRPASVRGASGVSSSSRTVTREGSGCSSSRPFDSARAPRRVPLSCSHIHTPTLSCGTSDAMLPAARNVLSTNSVTSAAERTGARPIAASGERSPVNST